ncbi:hypothetical protein [Streptomyces collinus]|uniref:hypothetical protein n=1 Tax=Streptomyces collinus TaxID=42684 RepID=UPI0034260244
MNAIGQIMVDRQMIGALVKFRGEIVTVLLEDKWFRVLHEGRQIAVTPRRHRTGDGKSHGTLA